MHFLYPAFLFALLTLAIPVIIHLFNFRRYQKVYFSNVQFLKEVQEQQASGRKLRERLILATRLLALAFLVFAFARPYIPANNSKIAAGSQQLVSVFVDNSYSMQALSREGALLDEAKTKAKEIAAAYDINTHFQVLTQDFEGKHQRLLSRDEFNDAVDAVKISPQSRNLQSIIERQQSLLQTQPTANKALYVISDFQKNMGADKLKTDSGTVINLIQLKANPLPNVAIDSVWSVNPLHRPAETEKILVKLHNYAEEKAEKIPLKLLINNTQKALGSYTINAGETITDTLTFSGLQAGWQKMELQLQDNPVTFDNQFFGSFYVQQQMPVLIVTGGSNDKYLEAVFNSDQFFKITETADGRVDYNGLSNFPLVVLSNIKTVSSGLAQQLKLYVEKGGTLSVFPAGDADLSSYKNLLQPLHAAYPEKLLKEDTRVSVLNLKSQLYKNTFENMPENPDLPLVKAYYQLNTSTTAEKLMSLSTGQPFLVQQKAKQGSVFVSAVPLDESFSNLPRHALFVTTMLRMALISAQNNPLYYKLGSNEAIDIPSIAVGADQVLTLVKGEQKIIPDVRRQDGNTYLFVSDQLQQPGIYTLKQGDNTLALLAFNSSKSESDLHYFNQSELQKIAPKSSNVITKSNGSVNSIISGANFGLQLWKLCLLLSLIFLATEIVLIRFYRMNKTINAQSGKS
ncbi:BatA domain-containing protein [Mucilaginibacter sp. KACC 22063]|uniref:BatA domain-containing protein n=1 Tax=Mucilaginibacter sp. KACC 22063 TaxID=3025666 RepID=UPI0023656AB1|nr:BatA domain-containing protein [Mucilaginibacter sp. KACC 22063]WDF57090.1 BatA domain-containing protein [Mucilaginibacter sp. KACC 22063]